MTEEYDLEKCGGCNRKFPEHLIQQFYTNAKDYGGRRCPICALAATNKIHGTNNKQFGGTTANEYLEEARAYLEKTELKLCPFCGSAGEYDNRVTGTEFIRCTNTECGAMITQTMGPHSVPVSEFWNTRVGQDEN